MGREEGEGFRMGYTCIPVADSFWYMAKPIQYCKVKIKLKKELIKSPILTRKKKKTYYMYMVIYKKKKTT